MAKEPTDVLPTPIKDTSLFRQSRTGSLLNVAMQDLTPDQRIALSGKAAHERLKLEVSEEQAEQRFYNSTRDMGNTLQAVHTMEKATGSDYKIDSRFETASGTTEIHVTKNNNTVVIVVAIVIGLALLFGLQ